MVSKYCTFTSNDLPVSKVVSITIGHTFVLLAIKIFGNEDERIDS